MSILITGCNGFLGRRLAAYWRTHMPEARIVGIGRSDVRNAPVNHYHNIDVLASRAVEQLFNQYDFQVVYHLAALTAHSDIVNDKFSALDINLRGTTNILNSFAKGRPGARFVYISTGKVYGDTDQMPIRESGRVNPTNILGKSKLIAERLVDFHASYNPDNAYSIVRLFNVYGPGQKSHFLVPTIVSQLKESHILTLGNLDDGRDYLYIDDVIDALWLIGESPRQRDDIPEIINIASGVSLTVRQIIAVIEQQMGIEIQCNVDPSRCRSDETPQEYACIDKAARRLGWKPQVSFEEGMARILESEGLLQTGGAR